MKRTPWFLGKLVILSLSVVLVLLFAADGQWSDRLPAVSNYLNTNTQTAKLHDEGRLPNVVFFNRIPKTGSEMLVLVITWLQARNDFKHIRLKNSKKRFLNSTQQTALASEINKHLRANPGKKISFDRHLHFLDMAEVGVPLPTYINMVRDPIEKLVSRFYYARVTPRPGAYTPKRERTGAKRIPPFATIEECLQAQGADCTFVQGRDYDLSVPYFCGHEHFCRELGNKDALEKAKYNLDKYYSVVGVLEELNQTLAVFEHFLPQFFEGVTELYFEDLAAPHFNKNSFRPRLSLLPATELKLRANLSQEIELYNFAKSRLNGQYEIIKKMT